MRINSPVASFPTPCHPLFTVDFANNDTLFCSSSFVTFRCKFPSYGSTAERMLFIVIKFGGYFIQRCPTILFTRRFSPTSCRAVNNFRLPFRRWFSTVPVDRYFFTTLSIVDQGMSNKSAIYDLLSFYLYNLTINSLVSVVTSLFLRPISFVCILQEVSTTDVKWCHGSRDVLFSLASYSNIIIIRTDVLM